MNERTTRSPNSVYLCKLRTKTSSPDKIACAPTPPAPRQCTPPRLAHSLRRTRMRPHSVIRIRTEHVSCELLAATHTHNTLHCTCTFLHSAHNKRVMNFLDTANTIHAPRASSRFSYTLRASPSLFFALEFSTGSAHGNIYAPCCASIATSPLAQSLARAGLSIATGPSNIFAPSISPRDQPEQRAQRGEQQWRR